MRERPEPWVLDPLLDRGLKGRRIREVIGASLQTWRQPEVDLEAPNVAPQTIDESVELSDLEEKWRRRAPAIEELRDLIRRQSPLSVEVLPETLAREDRDYGIDRVQVDPEGGG